MRRALTLASPLPDARVRAQQMQQYAAIAQQYPGAAYAQPYGVPPPTNQQSDQLKQFWASQMVEVQQVPSDPTVFKNHQLPLARIKKARPPRAPCQGPLGHRGAGCRGTAGPPPGNGSGWHTYLMLPALLLLGGLHAQIMKSDEDVRMISAEAPVLFAKVWVSTKVVTRWHMWHASRQCS